MRLWIISFLLSGSLASGCILDRSGLVEEGSGATSTTGVAQGGFPATGAAGPGGATATQGGGGAGPTTTSTGGSGGGLVEDCLNGVDDDGDMDVDCSDSDCVSAGYACVPVFANAGAYVSPVPAATDCPTGGAVVDLSQCGECSCTTDLGTCDVDISIDNNNNCNSPIATLDPGDPCTDQPDPASQRYFSYSNLTPNGDAGCTPDPATTTLSTTPACNTQAFGACADPNHVCIAKPRSATTTCVEIGAAETCPGEYSQERSFFTTPLTACNCDCVEGAQGCGPVHVNVNTLDMCPAPIEVPLTSNGCTDAGTISAWSVEPQEGTVTCTPQLAPDPPSSPFRHCCLP